MKQDKNGYNQEKIQKMNRTLLLNMLLREGVCSRIHLAELTQLKPATITNIVNDFIESGAVKEVGLLTGNKGRRSIGISINNEDYGVLAIRLSRKDYSVGIFNLSGEAVILERITIQANENPRNVFEDIMKKGRQLILESKKRRVLAIGMSIPGPYSIKKGRIEIMTGFSGWNEIPIREILESAFRIPVYIAQDANAAALAQYWYIDDDIKDQMLVYIAAGQGVGAGIICNGELIEGAVGTAGEIGHMSINFHGPRCSCGNYGCLEMYCSSMVFLRQIKEALHLERDTTLQEAAGMIRNGNTLVKELYLKACDMLAVGIVNIINSFNPSVIVLGDEMADIAPELMLERVTHSVKKRVLPSIFEDVRICLSVLQDNSMVYGAAFVAIEEIFLKPEQYFSAK